MNTRKSPTQYIFTITTDYWQDKQSNKKKNGREVQSIYLFVFIVQVVSKQN